MKKRNKLAFLGGGRERLEEWFNIWIEQRNFFPLRILPEETLTCTKSEPRQSCPGENDKVTRGIAEIISVKHLDSMQSNDASCSHFRGGENQFLHQVAICFSKCPCRPSPPSIYQFKCCKLIMCHCALYCFWIILILRFSNCSQNPQSHSISIELLPCLLPLDKR